MTDSYPFTVFGGEFKGKRVLVTGGTKGTRPDPEEAYRKRQVAKRLAHATSRVSSSCDKPVG
jgi:hypothetical protein